MKPTSAQIGAAVKAMKECSDGGELYYEADFIAAAKAALTAAAEVQMADAMTTPTPAQIEAAAKAIYKSEYGDLDGWTTGGDWSRKLAKVALTAAAEVGQKSREQMIREKDGIFHTAAAEVGERRPKQNDIYLTETEHEKIVLEAIAKTIERCAKELERLGVHYHKMLDLPAAMRKLKDKT